MAESIVTRVPLIGVLTPADMCGYVVESKYVQGGYIVVQTIAERNALTSKSTYENNDVLQNGCPVYVAEEKTTYRYEVTEGSPRWVVDTVDLTSIEKELAELRSDLASISIPTKVSELENDAGYVTLQDIVIPETDLSNYYNKSETENIVSEAVANVKIPTKVSELNNDAGYLTQHQSLDSYAKKEDVNNAVAVKADDVLFTDSYVVTKAIGDFVGDGTESLQGMTIREIFIKMLGATIKVVYDSVIKQIKEEKLPAYSMNESGDMEVAPYVLKEMTSEEAKADTAGQGFFYQIIASEGVIESGYQIATINQEIAYLTIAIPEIVTDFHVEIYDSTAGDWAIANWKVEKAATQTINGYTTYSVPEMYEITAGITIRVVIHNK